MIVLRGLPLPLPAPGCRMTVVIPACNEEALIGQTLRSLIDQREIDGHPLPLEFFDIIVFANNCHDRTAAVVHDIAAHTPHIRIFCVEGTLTPEDAHIGQARKYAIDLAADRFFDAAKPAGIVASIDSDTLAAEGWVAWIVREMRNCDAVAGHVTIAEADQERLLAPVRLSYARELAYRRILAEVEALIDPLPEDPQPRHASFVGASFAVTARCYRDAGGLPPLRRLEDVAFSVALRRIDARIRYSPLVRATTSARRTARVDGGFGTFISELHEYAQRGESARVEHPLRTLEDIESRALVRRIRQQRENANDIARAAAIFNVAAEHWLAEIDRALPLGTIYERIASLAEPSRREYVTVPVEVAIATLRAAAAKMKSAAVSRHDDAGADADNRAHGSLDAG